MRPAMAQFIRSFQEDFGDRVTTGFVIHPGGERFSIAPNVTALPFSEL
jgi:hypothetical protein